MQAKRPALLDEQAHHFLELTVHRGRKIGARLSKILKIRRRKYEHLAGAIVAIEIVALANLYSVSPAFEIAQFFFRLLREQVVGNTQRQLLVFVEILDDTIIFRVVLKATSRIDHASHAQPV